MNTTDFRNHLSRQLQFLQRSCKSYDDGFIDESIRIATVIRVLIHQTNRSTSLLTHLNANNIHLATTAIGAPPRALLSINMGAFISGSTGPEWIANTHYTAIRGFMAVGDWWMQVVYAHGPLRISRKEIVLGAANKDGGAHVDTNLTPEYAALAQSGAIGSFHYHNHDNSEITEPINDAHLVYIRQMGHELLNSPELTALTEQPSSIL